METVIKNFNKIATFSSEPEKGGNEVAHLLSLFWKAIAGLGDIAGGLAGLLSKVQA